MVLYDAVAMGHHSLSNHQQAINVTFTSMLLKLSMAVSRANFQLFETHIFPDTKNGVQAVRGSNQVLQPDSIAGYMLDTSSGPLQTPGPAAHLPGNIPWHTVPPLMHLKGRGPQAVGYTPAHATYPVIQHERIQQAYSTYNPKVVVVEVQIILKLPGQVAEKLIHVYILSSLSENIC
jgi:hypothetical protein